MEIFKYDPNYMLVIRSLYGNVPYISYFFQKSKDSSDGDSKI